jgi:hypothetical protein
VFELLSASASRTDRIERPGKYQATAPIQRYVILEQGSIAAIDFARRGADWIAHAPTAVDLLRTPEIEVGLPLAEIYADIPLATQADSDTAHDPTGSP